MQAVALWLLNPSGLTPHGFCLLWDPWLIWTHAIGDFVIGASYWAISLALISVARRRDLVFKPMFVMFSVFILLCGIGHWIDLVTLWIPAYGVQAIVKAATALASVGTAFMLFPLLPRILALPSPAQMLAIHEALRQSHEALETRVVERTRELVEANTKLRTAAADRERVEAELRQSHKMEAVGQLTGGLAHDFNNLLTAISGSLELIGVRAAEGRTTELGRYIDGALASTKSAAALTHRLLAFSRRQTLAPNSVNVNPLIGSMEDLFRRTMGASIHLEIKLAAGLWPLLCDPNQLENALLNLVINARDAMPDGGLLTIETSNRVLAAGDAAPGDTTQKIVPPGEYVALAVTDTGVGMPPNVAERAFAPFFTTKPAGQGTGLGLSMIYGFVQQSGGHVQLRSAEGHGTTVTIYLPRHFEAVESAGT